MDQSEKGSVAPGNRTMGKRDSGFQSANSGSETGSPRVQFGAGTKERDGSVRGVKRMKRSFKDIVLNEVIGTDSDVCARSSPSPTSKRGILKIRSEPALSKDAEKQSLCFVNQAYVGDDDNNAKDINSTVASSSSNPSCSVATTARSAFPFGSQSRSNSTGNMLADVVEMLFRRTSLDFGNRDMHPFGRDCTVETIMENSRPKRNSKNSAFSKLVLWMTLLSLLVGAAVGVIFLSETYNAKMREDKLLKASLNSTQI